MDASAPPSDSGTVLVAYATTEGQTRAVAERIAVVADRRGAETTLVNLDAPHADVDPASFDAVFVGGSIHGGSHQRSVSEFAENHRNALRSVPSGFFSVSLSAASDDPEIREKAEEYVERFTANARWSPDRTATVGGALKYGEYGFLKRFVMRRIVAKMGGDTDPRRDYEYTDWTRVERFAEEVLDLAAVSSVSRTNARG
ncbi:flavodoxin domain-containing protein [Halopelagius longus]|uniref:Protoporphyrinogen oxidase n=1 Tax=Halopelagius longus TaxID=1236180 RepID=A0A1H1EM69_9EURY|nr:flavodoxin domain-containing protein [Halopelagius longus]RDI71813.1 protoporphyrinogen oxidase [Halopelagius longus]SDQ89865.1 menaquinone-dependent protoporphyrinogen oxidase [Halopelagius longus]